MDINLVHFGNIVAILFDVGLLTIYFCTFFKKTAFSKKVVGVIYLSAIVIYYCSSNYLTEAYQKTIVYLFVCFLISVCYYGSYSYKLVLTVIYAGVGIIIETVAALLLTMLMPDSFLAVMGNSMEGYLLGLVCANGSFLIVIGLIWIVLQKKFPKFDLSAHSLNTYWDMLFFVLIIITILFSLAIDYLTIKRGMEYGLFIFVLLECLLIIFDIGIFYIFQKMERLQQEKLKSALVFQQNEAQQAFYKEAIQKNQQLKKIVHDEKNFLLGVEGYLKSGEIDAALAEVERQRKQLMSTITDYTGNIALDTVLTAKVEEARKQGITLQPIIMLHGQIMIEFLDLVLLLGNALDNAIEATEAVVQTEEKKIWLTMKLQQNILHIQVENPVAEQVVIENQTIVSGKKDRELHGFGISNMKTIMQKYHGTFDMQCSDKLFVLNIVLENVRV